MFRPTSIFTEAFKVVAMAALLPLQGFGCGVDFKVPKDHFDGVNEYGYVSYWDKIADLDLGEGLSIPLVIGFQSDREWASPYLGYGWVLALFDSNLVQTGENSFEMIAPDGYTVPLGRDGKKPTILSGPKGWKGEISGDTITLWATCGWKLNYTKGKITSIGTPKGKTLVISRDATGVAKEATYDGKVVVRVERDFKGTVTGLVLGDKHIGIEQTEKPRIQSILGKNVVAGKDMSLGKVSGESDVIKAYEYGVTDGLQPKLMVSDSGKSPRHIAWDPVSRFIKSDGEWTYDIKPSLIKGFNASIGRKNKANQEELWFLDLAHGREISKYADGDQQIKTWFTSGFLAGKVRSQVVANKENNNLVNINYSYDENGLLVRDYDSVTNTLRKYEYNQEGILQKIAGSNQTIWAEEHDLKGRVTKKIINGTETNYIYDDNRDFNDNISTLQAQYALVGASLIVMMHSGNYSSVSILDSNGKKIYEKQKRE